jgi:hypothetical protein
MEILESGPDLRRSSQKRARVVEFDPVCQAIKCRFFFTASRARITFSGFSKKLKISFYG